MLCFMLAACGGAPIEVAPPATTASASPSTLPVVAVEIARTTPVSFTETGIAFYGAMLPSRDGWDPYGRALHPLPVSSDLAPGSVVTFANVACTTTLVGGKAPTTCASKTGEGSFVDRLNACFRVKTIGVSAPALRAFEATPATTRPESPAQFVTVDLLTRQTEIIPFAPVVTVDDGCKNVPHPCDPGPRHIIDVVPTNPSKTLTRVVETRSFTAYGPQHQTLPTGVTVFPRTSTPVAYGAPMLAGGRPDPRFVVRRNAYPINSWEPPPSVSVETSKETLARIAPMALDREDEGVQLALVVDRAVLAYAIGDGESGKRYVRELDAWILAHPKAVEGVYGMPHTLETFHTLVAGGFTTSDPCVFGSQRAP